MSGRVARRDISSRTASETAPGWQPWVIGPITVFGAALTAFYMSRLFFMTFHGARRWAPEQSPHESPALMTVPMVVLGTVGLLWTLPIPDQFFEISPLLNWGTAFLMATAVYYFIISVSLAIGMLPFLLGIAGILTLFAPQIGELSLDDSVFFGSLLAIASRRQPGCAVRLAFGLGLRGARCVPGLSPCVD